MTELATIPAASAVARRTPISDKIMYAKALASSGMLPRQYQGNPANLLYAVEYAEMLGCHPLTAVTGVHVIEGKPSASAALISALVRKAGHRLRVTGDGKSATAEIIRSDDPDFTFSVTFTWDDAEKAGLTGKAVWKQYGPSMLKARAITQCARDACEDALSGLHYTAEELGAEVNEEGLPVGVALVDQGTPPTPAGPDPVQVSADPWADPVAGPVATTDVVWLDGWVVRVSEASTEDALRELWLEMIAKHQAKELTDVDRVDLTESFKTAARVVAAVAKAEALNDTEPTVDAEPDDAGDPS